MLKVLLCVLFYRYDSSKFYILHSLFAKFSKKSHFRNFKALPYLSSQSLSCKFSIFQRKVLNLIKVKIAVNACFVRIVKFVAYDL